MADEMTGAEEQIDAHGPEGETSTEDTSNDGAAEGDTHGADSEVQGDDDAGDVPVRKSAKDYIIERKERKIARLEGRSEGEADAGGADRPITLKDLETVLEPLKRSLVQSEDEKELQAAMAAYPEAKKMEKTVRRYMENPAYAQVPVDTIVRSLLYGKEAAKQKADDEARGTRQGGHTRRPAETKAKSAWDLTDEEFNKSVTKVMSGSAQ